MTTTVALHYRCSLDDGTLVASTCGQAPLPLPTEESDLLPAFVDAAARLTRSEPRASIRLEPEQAYGPRLSHLAFVFRGDMASLGLSAGQFVRLGRAPAAVASELEGELTVDANHPLAGEALNFELQRLDEVSWDWNPHVFVNQSPWRFARTMPHIPHWYTVRGQAAEADFERFVRYIRSRGYSASYRGPRNSGRASQHTYLRLGSWKYWTMGAPVEETTVINRAVALPQPPWAWRSVELDVDRLTAEEMPIG